MSEERIKCGEKFCCPHCGEEMEEAVEDYAIAGREGFDSQSEEQCVECDEWFVVENNGDGTCSVWEIEKDED